MSETNCGDSSEVEQNFSKVLVVGSIPIRRSNLLAEVAQRRQHRSCKSAFPSWVRVPPSAP